MFREGVAQSAYPGAPQTLSYSALPPIGAGYRNNAPVHISTQHRSLASPLPLVCRSILSRSVHWSNKIYSSWLSRCFLNLLTIHKTKNSEKSNSSYLFILNSRCVPLPAFPGVLRRDSGARRPGKQRMFIPSGAVSGAGSWKFMYAIPRLTQAVVV